MPDPTYFTCTLGQAKPYKENDDFTNINDFIRQAAESDPETPAVGSYIPGSNGDEEWQTRVLNFRELLQGSCATAQLIAKPVSIPHGETVGLLSSSTPEFLFAWLGLMRLGHPVLLIAPQCSPTAIAGLCKQCNVKKLFHDEAYTDLAGKSANVELATHLLPFNADKSPFELAQQPLTKPVPDSNAARDDTAYLHHSSGTSSSVPKPIPQTHYGGAGAYARFDGTKHATFTTTPLYHGGVADSFRAWTSRALIWLFPGKDVPITGSNIIKCLEVAAKTDAPPVKYFASVPYVLEMMAAEDKGMKFLRGMDIVAVGGAALPSEVGNRLVDQGVNLISRMGSAECGFLMSSHRDYEQDREWEYLRPDGGVNFEERDDGLCELIVPPTWPFISKVDKVSEDGSFATRDLFKRHPTIPNAWRYDSRADSQLTLITGKKFDPAPLEDSLAVKSSSVQDVLIFGNGRPCPGALVFRSSAAADVLDEDLLKDFAPAVEEVNRDSQGHARIPKSMLVPMPYAEKPLEKSSKGTVLRKIAEERYASEIEQAYEKEPSGKVEVADDDVESFVSDAVSSIVSATSAESKLESDTDLFAYGVDSVACIQIRHAVSRLLPQGSKRLPLTIVQDTGSIKQLSKALIDLRHDRNPESSSTDEQTKLMRSFVEKYSQLDSYVAAQLHQSTLTPPRTPSPTQTEPRKTILLTGMTGSLGSHLLCQLVTRSEVSRIHVLVRGASQQAAEERVRKALVSRKLPVPTDFERKVTIHISNLSASHLGLAADVYAKLAEEVDTIFHLAWAVDFILPLKGFRQHFAGLQNLLNLSLQHSKYGSSPGSSKAARLIFCSSTASVASYSQIRAGEEVPEEVQADAQCSGNIGYSRSKWVAENICLQAVKVHPELANAVSVVRVGQLSGDTVNGVWNKSEAYPLMLSSAKVTGCLPDLPRESVGWLPVDTAAQAFIELGLSQQSKIPEPSSRNENVQVVHLLNQDRTTTWKMLLGWLENAEGIKAVSPREWLAKLEDISAPANEHESHPSLKLLDFWKSAYGADASSEGDSPATAEFQTEETLRFMPVLRSVQPVDDKYALKLWLWVRDSV
ncbi:hypothetical protein CB0940_07556 [Cercospora beticola]|uniref:Carrier domain-containing protein n=1 Tax=Cercospora beticola TaxID=122368 RepID=A0A2G5H8A7_CERBT|nr:hypothetical protein CB0940_07556 [Cercospora beticola]PIA88765.1 hypothetical protein CB0940_07556 [Cercospora beticola]WPB03516.1 hypothetical protein RHO25_008156 [Cercospora beticola]